MSSAAAPRVARPSVEVETAPAKPEPAAPATARAARGHGGAWLRTTILMSLAVMLLLAWPLIPRVPSDLVNTAILACQYLVVVMSLVLLIGYVGQISLSQASFVGMGAFVSAQFILKLHLPFPFTLVVGAGVGAVAAAAVGVVALRVRGLFLAVATLIFGYLCDKYLFSQGWLVQSQSGVSIPFQAVGRPGTLPYFDLGDIHVFYYVALAVAVFTIYTVANLRDSRIGRAFAAVRGSEVAAESLGINVVRFKLLGFAVAGALAGLGGSLTLEAQRNVTPDEFGFIKSLYFLAIAVVGGLRSLGGSIVSCVLFALLVGEVFFRSPKLADYLDLISAGLLMLVLLFFQGGLGALPERIQPFWVRSVEPRLLALLSSIRRATARGAAADAGTGVEATAEPAPVAETATVVEPAPAAEPEAIAADPEGARDEGVIDVLRLVRALERAPAKDRNLPVARRLLKAFAPDELVAGEPDADGRRRPVLLEASDITVRFGGLTAVSSASLRVGAGEIVGLIGPNGAGKTTLFNSLLGLNEPTSGTVELFGRDVSAWPVYRRAELGVGRTFQILQLFADLTVFDNLLVATHMLNNTGLFGSLFVTPGARHHDLDARRRVSAVLKLMELEHVAHRRVAGLPFGVLRLVEVARTLVAGARLVCFDEPASGLDSAETERLIEWFRVLRSIGVTLLVIEHDVDMVVRLCDYIYVLDQGRLIAAGTPAEVQRDPHVVASYLGTDMEAAS